MEFTIAKYPSAGGLMASVLEANGVENVEICFGALPEQLPIGIESTPAETKKLDGALLTINPDSDILPGHPAPIEVRPQIWGINDDYCFDNLDLGKFRIEAGAISQEEAEMLLRDGCSANFTVANLEVSMSKLTLLVTRRQCSDEKHIISLSWQDEIQLTIRILSTVNDAPNYSAKYVLWYYLTNQKPTLRITRWRSDQETMLLAECQQVGGTLQVRGYELLSDNITLKTLFASTSELDEASRLGFLMPKW